MSRQDSLVPEVNVFGPGAGILEASWFVLEIRRLCWAKIAYGDKNTGQIAMHHKSCRAQHAQTAQVVEGNRSRNNILVNNGRKNVLPYWMFRDARPLDRVGRVFVTATESSLRAPLPAAVGNFHFTGALSTHHHTRTCSVQPTRIRRPFWILHSLRSYVYRSA